MAKKKTTSTPTPRPRPAGKKKVTFSLAAPEAQTVLVSGTFCDWQLDRHPLKKDRKGNWKTIISLAPGRYEYRFLVDGAWHDDPQCPERVANSYGSLNCVVEV
jgi:1,4-alpha-glucan branching enzyme